MFNGSILIPKDWDKLQRRKSFSAGRGYPVLVSYLYDIIPGWVPLWWPGSKETTAEKHVWKVVEGAHVNGFWWEEKMTGWTWWNLIIWQAFFEAKLCCSWWTNSCDNGQPRKSGIGMFVHVRLVSVLSFMDSFWRSDKERRQKFHIGQLPIFYMIHITSWWFQTFFIFNPTWGNDPIWRAYFSNGLVQPPTRYT